MMTDVSGGQGRLFSLDYEAWLEAELFKWLESERAGHDRGHGARQEWVRRYWDIFCRWRLLDHLYGRKRFVEFHACAFGCLCDPRYAADPVAQFVLKRFVEDRWENLNFLFTPQLEYPREPVFNLLDLFRINEGRHNRPCWYAGGKI